MDLWTQWEREKVAGESSISVCTLSVVRWIAGEKLSCSTGSPVWCSVMTWENGMGRGEGPGKEGMYA